MTGRDRLVSDIGLRMLTPRELARAQGFPDSFSLDVDIDDGKDDGNDDGNNGGAPLTRTAQTRTIGNSVCPPIAEALVRANALETTSRPLAA